MVLSGKRTLTNPAITPLQINLFKTGNKAADPLHDASRVLAMKRNNNERSLSRKFSSMPKVSSSLGKVKYKRPFESIGENL